MLKIGLVMPKVDTLAVIPNLGLGYLASSLVENGFEADIIHCGKEKLNPQEAAKMLSMENYDVVGLQTMTFFHNKAIEIARRLNSLSPGAKVIIGGPHASGMMERILVENREFDFGFSGEAEIGFVSLLKQIAGGSVSPETVPGLIWREGDRCFSNEMQVVQALDSLPMPLWHKMNPKDYPNHAAGMFAPVFPIAPVIASRGCNYNCAFCAYKSINGPGARYRSAENIVREIEFLYRELGVSTLAFFDQNFTARRDIVLDICNFIVKSDMQLKWHCPNGVRMESLDGELVERMRDAGCEALTVGLESASESVLNVMHRRVSLDTLNEKLLTIKKSGINITGNFIIGLPGETAKDTLKTILFSCRLPLDRVHFGFFVPFPGSELFSTVLSKYQPGKFEWSAFNVTSPDFISAMSKLTAWALLISAYFFFYIRPRILFTNIKALKSLEHLRFVFSYILRIVLIITTKTHHGGEKN